MLEYAVVFYKGEERIVTTVFAGTNEEAEKLGWEKLKRFFEFSDRDIEQTTFARAYLT